MQKDKFDVGEQRNQDLGQVGINQGLLADIRRVGLKWLLLRLDVINVD